MREIVLVLFPPHEHEHDDEDELYKFFDTLKHNYNYGMDLPKGLKDRILVHL